MTSDLDLIPPHCFNNRMDDIRRVEFVFRISEMGVHRVFRNAQDDRDFPGRLALRSPGENLDFSGSQFSEL